MACQGIAFVAALAAASPVALGPQPSAAPPAPAKVAAKTASAAAPAPAPASALEPPVGCCADPFPQTGPNGERPLTITVESGISAGRLGLEGRTDGETAIDPQTGTKQVVANMVDLGGLSYQGKATITGQPLRPVRIELPRTVVLYSQAGGEAELSDFRTDLPGVAMLDASGQLQFNFGATISSKGGQGGNFRGRIPIRVEYY